MRQTTFKLMLVLLAVLLPTAWVFANGTVTIAAMQNGTVVTSHTTAEEGETVTLTVKPAENYLLAKSSLVVERISDSGESDRPTFSPRRAPRIGDILALTQTAKNTYTFVMPADNVLVSAAFFEQGPIDVEGDKAGDNTITFNVEPDYDNMTAAINQVSQDNSTTPMKVHIPPTVTDGAGNVFTITLIAGYAFYGMPNVTDIYLPDSDAPLTIEEGAFLLDGETGANHKIAAIHVPFMFLDDYALLSVLSENYQASKMIGALTATHRYRTASCAVDIQLPADIQAFTAHAANGLVLMEAIGSDIVKANNGVLLAGPVDGSHDYEVTAIPTADRPSGMTPPADNAQSYPNNQLVPVTEARHFFYARNYYVLHNNQFYPVLLEDEDKCCPAGRAVLRAQ